MVQLAHASFSDLPFYFNLHGGVGKGYPAARQDDVLFVQYFFSLVAANTANVEIREAFSKVVPIGMTDEATLRAITFWQQTRKATFSSIEVDGIISAAKGSTGFYARGALYDIVQINYSIMSANSSIWPRIDKDPHCPPTLAPVLRTALGTELTA